MPKFEIRIDHDLCWGCKTCEVACKQENRAPDGVKLIRVEEDGPRPVGDKLEFGFQVNLCRHCDDPPCADVCADEAIRKRADGIVVMDYDLCTGCQACIDECPYDAISYDYDRNIANKCNLCHHRIDQGLIPACADNVCLAHCINFTSYIFSPPRSLGPARSGRCDRDSFLRHTSRNFSETSFRPGL